ncbi:MAG: hypothetical protein HOI66_07860 [Verrucomicrobia bacterium]|jgi:hypothetical protein|nr:hypothetical protein [Verrucomicrobiota bacterium]
MKFLFSHHFQPTGNSFDNDRHPDITLQINSAAERSKDMEQKRIQTAKSLVIVAGVVGITACANVFGQSVGVGFAPIEIPQGFSLVSNPLATGANRVQDLIGNAPDGFELIKLAGGVWQTNRFSGDPGAWSVPDMTLTPGEGALASSPSAFTWNSIGKPVTGMLENFVPAGESIRSSVLPLTGLISTDLGFPTAEGLSISTVDEAGAFSIAATYEGGAWQPEEPVLSIGSSVLVTAPTASVWNKDFVLADDDNPLAISEQPQGVSVNAEEGFSLTITAGGADSLTYQWQRNGNDIEGANEATYAVTSAGAGDIGSYSVVVFTSTHSVRSQQASVEVILPEPEPEPEPEPTPEPPVVTPPASGITIASRLSEDGSLLEVTINGEAGQVVRVEATRDATTDRWLTRAAALVIGEDGQAIHTEQITEGRNLFVRVLPQVAE